MYESNPLYRNLCIKSIKDKGMRITLYSKSNSHEQIDETGESSKCKEGDFTSRRRVPGTKVLNANFARSRQRGKGKVNLGQTVGGVGGKATIATGSDDVTRENINKLCVPTVTRLGEIPRSATAGANVSEQGQHWRF